MGLVDLGFGRVGVGATLWALLAGFGALLGGSWLLLGGPGPALGTFLGPRGHLLAGLGRILGGFWVPGTLWALILRSGDVPGRVLVCLGVAALCLELSLQEVGGTFHSTLSFQLTESLLLLRARVLPWFLLLLALSCLVLF